VIKNEPETLFYNPILLRILGIKIDGIPFSVNFLFKFREKSFWKKINKILLFMGKQKFKLG